MLCLGLDESLHDMAQACQVRRLGVEDGLRNICGQSHGYSVYIRACTGIKRIAETLEAQTYMVIDLSSTLLQQVEKWLKLAPASHTWIASLAPTILL